MLKQEKSFIILFLLLIVGLFFFMQLYLYSLGFFAFSADEAGHTLEAYYWYKGVSDFHSIWLPFQKVFYALLFHIDENLFWTPRIVSSIFGLFTLISLMYLTYQLFQDKIVSLISGLLGTFFWGIVIFSVLPMTEIYFCFFSTASIAFLIKWWRHQSFRILLIALLSIGIASTIRYEAWVFIFIIFISVSINFINTNEQLLIKLVKFCLVILFLFSFPATWVFLSYKETGQIFGFIQSVTERYKPGNIFSEIQNNVIFNFLYINIITLNIIGLVTYIYIKKKKEIKFYFFLLGSTLMVCGIFTFFSKAMPTHNSWRLATLWSILLLPLTAYFFYFLYSAKDKRVKYISIFLTIIFVFILFNQINRFSQFSYMSKEDLVIGDYINNYLLSKDEFSKIFIQDNSWECSNLLISSQHPLNFITEKKLLENSTFRMLPYYESEKQMLKEWGVKYIIMKPYNEDFFNNDKLRLIKRFSRWVVYKLE